MRTPVDIARENNGFVTSRQAAGEGIARARLSEAVSRGELVRSGRGVFYLPDAWEDEFAITQNRYSRGVFSDETSLYLHDFTDRTPERLTMTFPRSYNASAARDAGIVVRTCSPDVFELGAVEVETPSGNRVRAYDLERTLCDLLRGRSSVNEQVVNPAMKRYASMRGRDVGRLLDYAERLGVLGKVRNYMEVLL